MKKLLTILVILIIMFGLYMLFDYVKNSSNKNIITNTVNNVNKVTDITVRQSATNFINALEIKIATEYASGNTTNLNTTYTDIDSVSMRGLKPNSGELIIVIGKVTDGTLEYDKYTVEILDGKVKQMIKK